jgi:phospholipid transport system substrate-binding protein
MMAFHFVALLTVAGVPLETVKAADASVSTILQGPEPRLEKLSKKADETIDFGELAKRTLGKTWPTLSKKQQEQFSLEMKGLLRASYAQRALSENSNGAAKFEYGAEKIAADQKEATVETAVQVKGDKIPVHYRLFRNDTKSTWKIYDVVTDEVSLVVTYQDQFRQVIAKKGIDGLISTIKSKRLQLEGQQKEATSPSTP